MAKRLEKWIELTSTQPIGHLKERGPVAPVASYGKMRGWLQDGQWLPGWLVWLRRRKRVALALLAGVGGAVVLARLIGGAKR